MVVWDMWFLMLFIQQVITASQKNHLLSFAGLSQKASINFYHMGIYAEPKLLEWFVNEYPKHSKQKLDMGKSCVRFKKMEDIPYELIAELMQKISVEQWIEREEGKLFAYCKKK